MKAIIWTKYGNPDSLQLAEIEKPVPGDDEIRIKIHATTVTAGDCELRDLTLQFPFNIMLRMYFGVFKPLRVQVLGMALAGKVESVGKNVTRFAAGDRVFAVTDTTFGAYAEYLCLAEDAPIAPIPANVSYQQATAIPVGGVDALHFLRKANLQPGQHLLINGAGGTIGTFGIQIAKQYGVEITAVDSGEKLAMLSEIGADHVIDYTRDDFSKSGQHYDVIFDIVGKGTFLRSIRALKSEGLYLGANPHVLPLLQTVMLAPFSRKKIIFSTADYSPEDLQTLGTMAESGQLSPVIDRTYPLEDMAEAHRYVESGRKQGNVTISVA
ncbi:MAG: NAD(P)-dependent alcohol dehydrogenase [Aggregatilineales bacterium]